MKITEYQKVQTLTDDNIFILDGDNGTRVIGASDLAKSLADLLPYGRLVLTTRVRDPTQPTYGLTDDVAMLSVSDYTGMAAITAIINGIEYDVDNLSTDGANAPDGNMIITK